MPYRRPDRNSREVSPVPGLPSPSSLRDATSPKVGGLGISVKSELDEQSLMFRKRPDSATKGRRLLA